MTGPVEISLASESPGSAMADVGSVSTAGSSNRTTPSTYRDPRRSVIPRAMMSPLVAGEPAARAPARTSST